MKGDNFLGCRGAWQRSTDINTDKEAACLYLNYLSRVGQVYYRPAGSLNKPGYCVACLLEYCTSGMAHVISQYTLDISCQTNQPCSRRSFRHLQQAFLDHFLSVVSPPGQPVPDFRRRRRELRPSFDTSVPSARAQPTISAAGDQKPRDTAPGERRKTGGEGTVSAPVHDGGDMQTVE